MVKNYAVAESALTKVFPLVLATNLTKDLLIALMQQVSSNLPVISQGRDYYRDTMGFWWLTIHIPPIISCAK